ncbi:MAG TPA: YitT family protein, partial [Burkholderiaceae bacterium]
MFAAASNPMRHTPFEDVLALFSGTLFVSVAMLLFNQAGLLTGGTAGAAFLLHYATGVSFGKVFFVLNLPFYWFAWRRMGREFTLKTFVAIALLSLMTDNAGRLISISALHPLYASVL